ncbi:MAG: acetyl-CoA carboxylase biotin carboxylase subunit [Hyphomonadaceae bacterium]|nr:acetyl-CoA carboxylase biotin carboxylase subunit [Hyphomonadaceae bacterium]
MLKKILIANRGEIAVRIITTARRLGVKTVAVVSEADRGAPFAAMAEEVVQIGPGPATESYLRIDKIIAAAQSTGADGIHPGYGFLAENADFAEAVGKAGIKFIGPSPSAMRRMGGKAEAKAIAAKVGVPVVPGYQGDNQTAKVLAKEAKTIGYPVMIKAVAGGGGRGMRLVEREADLAAALESAQREAEAAFGDARVLIEKVIAAPRHIEVQVFGDSHGNVVHLFERDCSLQRRNQKVIEEAPAPGMAAELRARICEAAVACAKAVHYESAGTVEFLVEGGKLSAEAPWYFIEMNTRLQVEHPVTEAITGLDLVEWQLRIASGERLPLSQGEISMSGHAIEARLCAEDPAKGFLPSTGPIVAFEMPVLEGLRVDAGVEQGSVIPPYYDSMIAKLIGSAPDRAMAIARLGLALEQTQVAGPRTNAAFLHALLEHPDFARGRMHTGLIGRELAGLTAHAPNPEVIAFGVLHMLWRAQDDAAVLRGRRGGWEGLSPWNACDGFQLGGSRSQEVTVLADGTPTRVQVAWGPAGPRPVAAGGKGPPYEPIVRPTGESGPLQMLNRMDGALSAMQLVGEIDPRQVSPGGPVHRSVMRVVGNGNPLYVLHDMRQTELRWPEFDAGAADEGANGGSIRAPIIGRVAKVFVRKGATVAKGDRIAVVEAMKMEHVLHAPRDGVIDKLVVKEGEQVVLGALIATLAD